MTSRPRPVKGVSESGSAPKRKGGRPRKYQPIEILDPDGGADLRPTVGQFYPGRPETAEAVAHLTQYDEGEDGILILER